MKNWKKEKKEKKLKRVHERKYKCPRHGKGDVVVEKKVINMMEGYTFSLFYL